MKCDRDHMASASVKGILYGDRRRIQVERSRMDNRIAQSFVTEKMGSKDAFVVVALPFDINIGFEVLRYEEISFQEEGLFKSIYRKTILR